MEIDTMNYLELANEISKSKWNKNFVECVKFEQQFVVKTICETM
jgi:hypothetical protein